MASLLSATLTVLFCIVLQASCETSTTTLLQLRESVQFSYSASNLFLDLIRGTKPPTVALKSFVQIQNSGDQRITFRSVEPIVSSYVGFGICLVLGILFAVLMPLIGFIFCCARCCGKCGGRVQLMDKKKDPCRRVAFTICLVIIVTIQLVAVVLAFINHFLLHEALIHEDPRIGSFSQLNLSLIETEQSLDTIYRMSINTSSVNVDDRKERFNKIVNDGLQDFQREFIRRSNAEQVTTPIINLQTIVTEFSPESEYATFLAEFNKSLVRLSQELPSIQNGLLETLDPNCPLDKHIKCGQLMQEAQKNLKVRYTVEQFQPDEVSALIEQLGRHHNDFQSLSEFEDTLSKMASIIDKAISEDLNRAWDDLVHSSETREKLARSFEVNLREIKGGLAIIRERLHSHQDEENSQVFLRSVEFQFYGGIALLCIPVLIFMLFYLGLCFGTCGHRPYEEAGVCNRGVGANLLLAGVGFVFLFSTILMVVCVVLFLAGGPVQTELCRYLTGHVPNGPRKLDDYVHESMQYIMDEVRRQTRLRQELAAENSEYNVTIRAELGTIELIRNITRARLTDAILTRCENEPFVDAISGGQLMWPALYEPIQSILQELIDSFKAVNLNQPLEDTIRSCMEALERVKFLDSVDFSSAIEQTKLSLTYITDLDRFVAELRSLNVDELQPHIDALTMLPLKLDQLRDQALNLYNKLDSLSTVRKLIQQHLEDFQQNLSVVLSETMDAELTKVRSVFEKELQLAVIATWRDIPCQSLRIAVKRGVDSVCITALMPLNAFWAGLGLALLLFIPGIIFAVKLAGLYRKTEPYSSDYEEPDYISYHGFYMRPTSDYQVVPQKPRNKVRKQKGYTPVPQSEA